MLVSWLCVLAQRQTNKDGSTGEQQSGKSHRALIRRNRGSKLNF